MGKDKEYSNGDVTIVWKPDMCIHSEKCWRGLPSVFNPKSRPWINAEGASSQEIIDQVKNCPSGALSYYTTSDKSKNENTMSEVKAQVIENGPFIVSGGIEIVHKDGTKEVKEKASFCRCGHSANKPFCDGSHKAAEFKG